MELMMADILTIFFFLKETVFLKQTTLTSPYLCVKERQENWELYSGKWISHYCT